MNPTPSPLKKNPALQILKQLIGKNLTKNVRPIGHGLKGQIASLRYARPVRKLKLIAITGTKGKTTTTIFLGRLMNLIGIKTGYISTASLSLGGSRESEFLNPYKMTSIDGFLMQDYFNKMIANGCEYCVVEMSSEGLKQNRHWGMGEFEATLFLNLYPEHLESHGGLENYIQAKSTLFTRLKSGGVFIANGEKDQLKLSQRMLDSVPSGRHKGLRKHLIERDTDYQIIDNNQEMFKMLKIKNRLFNTRLIADFELTNLYYCIKTVELLFPIKYKQLISTVNIFEQIGGIPGRMEWVVWNNKIL